MNQKSIYPYSLLIVILVGLSTLLQACATSERIITFQKTAIEVFGETLELELAKSQEQQQLGLMYRSHLPANQGMLFVFREPDFHCMWMKNTLIPLSVGFFDPNGKLTEIQTMTPRTSDTHCSAQPVLFALELNEGGFERFGLSIGQQLVEITRFAH
jgi:uncharacterized membrane protein (UPF0127 family)